MMVVVVKEAVATGGVVMPAVIHLGVGVVVVIMMVKVTVKWRQAMAMKEMQEVVG
jgi:Mrp family chromosome partitioning ATPase